MSSDRASAIALIAGSAGLIIALGLHPSGRGLFDPEHYESAARELIAVHSLALACLPVLFFGALGLSRAMHPDDRFGLGAVVLYGFAMAGVMSAITFDGLVSPGLAGQINTSTGTVGQGWRIAFNYNSMIDQAFMRLFLVASLAAIILWSFSFVRSKQFSRGLAIYGGILGTAGLTALFAGWMNRSPHLFGAAILGEAIWFVGAGVRLLQTEKAFEPS